MDRRVGLSQVVTIISLLVFWLLNFDSASVGVFDLVTDFGASFISVVIAFGVINTGLDIYLQWRRYVDFREPRVAS
jgi:hypothetical protein